MKLLSETRGKITVPNGNQSVIVIQVHWPEGRIGEDFGDNPCPMPRQIKYYVNTNFCLQKTQRIVQGIIVLNNVRGSGSNPAGTDLNAFNIKLSYYKKLPNSYFSKTVNKVIKFILL